MDFFRCKAVNLEQQMWPNSWQIPLTLFPFPPKKVWIVNPTWELNTFGMVWRQRQLIKLLSWVVFWQVLVSLLLFLQRGKVTAALEKALSLPFNSAGKGWQTKYELFQHSSAGRASFLHLEKLLNKDLMKQIIIILKEMVIIAFQDCAGS